MVINAINLTVRFILELAGLVTFGLWGWEKGDGIFQYLLAAGVPIIAASIWGVFAVVDDPSRSGKAPVVVSGLVRLIIEFAFFAAVVWALFVLGHATLGWYFGVVVVIHYMVSYERVIWLLQQ